MAATWFALSGACSDDTIICTAEYRFGLGVDVKTSTGDPVCDVTIRLQDGSYIEQKALSETDCFLTGAGERAGTYRVTVSRGDTLLAEEVVTVRAEECHVEGKSLTVVVDD